MEVSKRVGLSGGAGQLLEHGKGRATQAGPRACGPSPWVWEMSGALLSHKDSDLAPLSGQSLVEQL